MVEAEGIFEPTNRVDKQRVLYEVCVRSDGVLGGILPGLLAEKSGQEIQRFPKVEDFVAVGDYCVDRRMKTG